MGVSAGVSNPAPEAPAAPLIRDHIKSRYRCANCNRSCAFSIASINDAVKRQPESRAFLLTSTLSLPACDGTLIYCRERTFSGLLEQFDCWIHLYATEQPDLAF